MLLTTLFSNHIALPNPVQLHLFYIQKYLLPDNCKKHRIQYTCRYNIHVDTRQASNVTKLVVSLVSLQLSQMTADWSMLSQDTVGKGH